MRSRPSVKLLLSPATVTPGSQLACEAILDAKSETPIDFVSLCLRGTVRTTPMRGQSPGASYLTELYAREWRSPKGTLTRGEHRYRATFDLPDILAPSFAGASTSIQHLLTVHVSIPWWADRNETFVVPIAFPESETSVVKPESFASSPEGPRGTEPYIEVAVDSTYLTPTEILSGSISISNLRGRKVRGIDVSFVEVEAIEVPHHETREGRRFRLRTSSGSPPEGEPQPFRVRVPPGVTPSFGLAPMAVSTHLEVRVDIAWGEDIVLRVPLHIAPKARAIREKAGWVAPVGQERRALVWSEVATRAGLVADPESERMSGQRGIVNIEIHSEQRDADFFLVAGLGFPSLGLELEIHDRKWTDALAFPIATGDAAIDDRFAIHAREPVQAKVAVTAELLRLVRDFESVAIDDVHATLAARGTVHTTEGVQAFVDRVLVTGDAIAAAHERVPPPIVFAADALAWRSFADRIRGRFEPGRMWIHDGQVGTDRVAIGSEWSRGVLVGSTIEVAIDPPLEKAPIAPDDPAISPAARAAWNELVKRVKGVAVGVSAITLEIEGKIADPRELEPTIDLVISLRRALAGVRAQGPFR